MSKPSYTTKIDALLEHATQLGFTGQDFAELALASADQSGASLADQKRIADALDINTWDVVHAARARSAAKEPK